MKEIAILCAAQNTNYRSIPGLQIYDQIRDTYTFPGGTPVIAHAPCQQWSRMKAFAKEDPRSKELAFFCLEQIHKYGGIFEHPAGSSFFKTAGIKPTISVQMNWYGFPARKLTYLYFYGCKPLSLQLNFDAITKKVANLGQVKRSESPLSFCQYLVDCIRASDL